mgnify:CR=1 FL=1
MAVAFPRLAKTDPITEARVLVERLFKAELDLSTERQAKGEALARAEAQAGTDILQIHLAGQGDRATVVSLVAALRGEIGVLDKAIEAARRRRLAAIPQVWRAEADAKRAEAHKLHEEADTRQGKTERLLRELADFEGCAYAPEGPAAHSRPVASLGGAPAVVIVPTPRTELLRQQAQSLEREAVQLEAKRPVTSGYVRAESRQEALGSLASRPDGAKASPNACGGLPGRWRGPRARDSQPALRASSQLPAARRARGRRADMAGRRARPRQKPRARAG